MYGDDAAGVILPGYILESRFTQHGRVVFLAWERLDGVGQIDKARRIAGEEPAPEGNHDFQVNVIQRAPQCIRRGGEFEAGERAARFEHAVHLGKRLHAVGDVANAVGHGDRVVGIVGIGDVLGVHHFEIEGDAVAFSRLEALLGHVEHFGHEVGKLDMGRGIAMRRHVAYVARAACQVEQVGFGSEVGCIDRLAQPTFVEPEARECIEFLILLGDGSEYVLYALLRKGRFGFFSCRSVYRVVAGFSHESSVV